MTKIALLGCGWLGFPLAEALIYSGYSVNGSTTTPQKLSLLTEAGIAPYLIDLGEGADTTVIQDFLKGCDVLIINIPPKIRSGSNENYPAKMQQLVPFIKQAGISKVLFVSSTSVYADDNTVVTESTVPNPETESGRQVLEAENVLANHFTTTILRFGGLIGNGRNPAKYLAGKDNLPNPDAPVNLIHQDDCIGIILTILEKGYWGKIVNGVAEQHPTRKEYYTQKAAALQLPPPGFDNSKPSIGKTVTSEVVGSVLGYVFKQPV